MASCWSISKSAKIPTAQRLKNQPQSETQNHHESTADVKHLREHVDVLQLRARSSGRARPPTRLYLPAPQGSPKAPNYQETIPTDLEFERCLRSKTAVRNTVDGRNPAPVDMELVPLFRRFTVYIPVGCLGFLPSTVVFRWLQKSAPCLELGSDASSFQQVHPCVELSRRIRRVEAEQKQLAEKCHKKKAPKYSSWTNSG